MKLKHRWMTLGALAVFFAIALAAHEHNAPAPATGDQSQQELNQATAAMSHPHMEMSAHMKMTALRPPDPADQERADEIVQKARAGMEKYKDYRAALADGYKIFLPNMPAKMKHFTNYRYSLENSFRFNPEHPTSLLYEPDGKGGYKLIGAMFTAPLATSEDQLNQRVPLSVAQWHEHVNFCWPPAGHRDEMMKKNPRFGMLGSITTKEECDQAGGHFMPHLFGWMVHFYPYEKTSDQIWSVERQLQGKDEHQHEHMH